MNQTITQKTTQKMISNGSDSLYNHITTTELRYGKRDKIENLAKEAERCQRPNMHEKLINLMKS